MSTLSAPEISTVLAASTGHVTKPELDRIATGPFMAYPHVHGAFVWVAPAADGDVRATVPLEELDAFPNLTALVVRAQALGVSWVNLDEAAPEVDGLATFDW